MNKIFFQLVVIAFMVTLTSCDWDPTIHSGNNSNGNDTVQVDTVDHFEMRIDLHESEVFSTHNMKVIKIVSIEFGEVDQRIVKLSVTSEDTSQESIITLTSGNPIVEVDGCFIELLYVQPMTGLPGEGIKYVVSLKIY